MSLINYKINLILTYSSTCIICSENIITAFKIADTKLYVPVVALSNQDNAKLLQQLRSGFKRTVNWNKCQSKVKIQWQQNPYLNYLVDPSFQGANRLFVLSFGNDMIRARHTYFLPKVEIIGYNVMINGQNVFDQSVKKYLRT